MSLLVFVFSELLVCAYRLTSHSGSSAEGMKALLKALIRCLLLIFRLHAVRAAHVAIFAHRVSLEIIDKCFMCRGPFVDLLLLRSEVSNLPLLVAVCHAETMSINIMLLIAIGPLGSFFLR